MLINGIFLIILGALGASSFIVSKRPDAKDALAKLAPAQGVLGTIGALWGVWAIINTVLNIGVLLKAPVALALGAGGGVALFGTGFLLGFPWFMSFNKNAEAAAKAEQLRSKLVAYQTPMGGVCIVLGVLAILAGVLL